MKMRKRCLALLIAMVMTVTAFAGNGAMITYANSTEQNAASEEMTDESVPAESDKEETAEPSVEVSAEDEADNLNTDAIENVVRLFEALPTASDLSSMSSDEINIVMQQMTEAINAFDALGNKECDYIIENYPELYDNVMNKLSGALAELQQGGIGTMSLLPLEEVKAYLMLTGYTEETLSAMPVDSLLNMLEDSDGNKVEIANDATTVWKYSKDDVDGIEEYEEYSIGANETMNIYPGDGIDTFQFEIIVGDKGQLNSTNKRYIVVAYLTDDFEEDLDLEIYIQSEDNTRTQAVPSDCKKWIWKYDEETDEIVFDLSFDGSLGESLADNGTVWLNFKSKLAENPRVQIEIYPVLVYEIEGKTYYVTIKSPITSQILNQNMEVTGSGYQIAGERNTDETFQMVTYIDGEEYSQKYIGVRYWNWYPLHDGKLFSMQDEVKTNVFEDVSTEFDAKTHVSNITFELKENLSASDQYYFDYDLVRQLNYGSGSKVNCDNWVKKIVLGHYDTIEEAEAAGAEDVTSEVLSNGYLSDYSGAGIDFTVFKYYRLSESFPLAYDTLADKINVRAVENSNSWRAFTDAPIIGEADPWLRVTGATDNDGNEYDTYVVENGKNINMDTYYGYGYQTIFINDADADLSQLKPTFWYANTDRVYAVSNDSGDRVDEDHIRDFSSENQQYTGIIIDNDQENERNYWVTFKKLNNNGPELYVYGPSEREVILDEYFEFKHDILIANIGNEPLEDISVELVDAENVKLDPYWTVGGAENDKLAPFTSTTSDTQYGELANLAKIRLLPAGEGEVKGTLIISAKDQDPVMITLNGTAQNPEIITETLSDAVKYVPYQQIVATNNMHDWVETKFSIVDGELPEGVTLNSDTGEIYGAPKVPEGNEDVTYTFTVEAEYFVEGHEGYFEPSRKEYTLTVKPNTDENVYLATDSEDGYAIEEHIGTQTGEYSFELEGIADTLFVSGGEYGEFVGLWLNGELLEPGVDYDSESGSTRVTIKAQTFENKTDPDGTNTIAMEFRKDTNGDGTGDSGAEMNRTAQNFTVKTESSVDSVIAKIAALPSNITLNDKSAVQSARNAYNALSASDQARVTNRQKLFDAEAKIAQLEADKAAADQVIAKINAIPPMINFDARDEIAAARAAYNELTAAQKNLVTNYNRLVTAENALAQYEKDRAEAGKVVNLINSLPDTISLDDKDAVNSARAAYNVLTSAQKGYVTNYSRLQAAEERIIQLEAEVLEQAQINAVIAAINALPYPVTLDDKETVEAVRTAYDALTDAQKAKVINYNILAAAESTIAALEAQEEADKVDKAAAEAVIELIDAIPDEVSLSDKTAVEAARTAYDELTENQKKLVTNYYELINAETVIQTLEDYENATAEDRAAADEVIDLINTLPEEITLEDKSIVESVRTAYDALTDNQKKIVINYQLLVNAEVRIAELEDESYEEIPSVTFVGIVVDKDGNALPDRIIEMHSSVQTARTDENGSFQFNDVEFGDHTLCIKDENGNIIAQREFNIVQGSPLAINENDIVAENGSVFTVRMMVDGSDLTFLNIEEGNKAPAIDTGKDGIYIGEADQWNSGLDDGESGVKTGDNSNIMVRFVFLSVSIIALVALIYVSLKRKRDISSKM